MSFAQLGSCISNSLECVLILTNASIFSVDSNTIMKRARLIFSGLLLCLFPLGASLLTTSSSRVFAQDVAATANDVSSLVEALSNQDPKKRWQAAQELGQMGPKAVSAAPALADMLKDQNASVRQNAAMAIGYLGDSSKQIIEKLILAVGDDDARVRIAAVVSIRQLIDDPEILIPLVVKILDKEDPLFASRMVETIVMRGEKAVPFLVAALKNERAAYWACLAIEELGATAGATVPALVELLASGPDDDLKVQSLLALAKIGPQATPAKQSVLAALASDSSDSVLTAAAYAAGSLGLGEATSRLEVTKDSNEPLLAMVSLWALAKLHPEDSARLRTTVDHLVKSLSSDDASIRLAAAKGLQSLPLDPDVIGPKLIQLLDDSDPIVAYNLVETFVSLGEPVAGRAGNALANEKLRSLAVQVLERLGPKAKIALPQIVSTLHGAEGEFRRQLQTVVGEIGPDAAPATEELIRSLDDESEETRISALLTLGKIGPGAAAASSKLLTMTDGTKDPFEQLLAAWAIAKIASADEKAVAKIVPILIKGLSFPDGRVQAEAATTLGSLGPAAHSAVDALDALAAKEIAPLELREIAKKAADDVR